MNASEDYIFQCKKFTFVDNADEAPAISPRMLAKQLNIGNPATLERRIQQELEEQGCLAHLCCFGGCIMNDFVFVLTCLCVHARLIVLLLNAGILETEEEVEDDPSDEILQELKHAQAELRPLLQWKVKHLKDLLKKAKEQQARQQLWKKFDECDAKVSFPFINNQY